MGDAVALWAPTLYCEPFGGVVVEAAMCGTPAITSDFGALQEHVIECLTGFTCRILSDFIVVLAAQFADLDRAAFASTPSARYLDRGGRRAI